MSDSITLEFEESGITRASIVLDKMERDVAEVSGESLYQSFELVMARSKADFVPVDTGFLASTGFVTLDKSGSEVIVLMGYSAEYAAAVHEINKNYKGGRQWKYLETPLKAAFHEISERTQRDLMNWIMGL